MTRTSKVKTKDGTSIDPALLFQQFIYFTQTGDVSMIEVIGYELCPYPPGDKPALATALRQVTGKVSPDSGSTIAQTDITNHYVLDGGSLLHRIKGIKGKTYGNIAEHANFVLKMALQPLCLMDIKMHEV